jgi:hypothetical protein
VSRGGAAHRPETRATTRRKPPQKRASSSATREHAAPIAAGGQQAADPQAPLHRPQSPPRRQAVYTIGLPAPISRLAVVWHPTDRAPGRVTKAEVGRPGCGSPAARLGEDNARLRPPSCPIFAVFRWRCRTVSSAGASTTRKHGSLPPPRQSMVGPVPARERLPAAHLGVLGGARQSANPARAA